MFRTIIGTLVTVGILFAQAGQVPPEFQWSLQFHVVDSLGRRVPYQVSHFREVTSGREAASRFKELAITGIPIGYYDYTLVPTEPNGRFRPVSGKVGSSSGGRNWKTVVVYPDESFADRGTLPPTKGRVTPPPPPGAKNWIRVIPALPRASEVEVPVATNGDFEVPDFSNAVEYVLIVFSNGRVLSTASAVLPTKRRVEIQR